MSVPLIGALLVALAATPAIANSDDRGVAVREFMRRVDAYVELHRALERDLPALTVTADAARIVRASDALAAAIVAARPEARQGDLFTPPVSALFRERILVALNGVEMEHYLDELYEGEDFRTIRAVIHGRDTAGRVPAGVPVSLLWVLPELPPELDYRVIGRDLALWDHHAAMVVDFIANAFPALSLARAVRSGTPVSGVTTEEP
jgi:hypothetical protein